MKTAASHAASVPSAPMPGQWNPARTSALNAACLIGALCLTGFAEQKRANAQDDATKQRKPDAPPAYVVHVDLPLVGQRDEQVKQQIERLLTTQKANAGRKTVVLQFRSNALSNNSGESPNSETGSRGSQFERCLSLARYLSKVTRLRLIAYLPETVEGHAVLPVLACEEIVVAAHANLGAASIDEPADAGIESTYREMRKNRSMLFDAVVLAMLRPDAEVYSVTKVDDGSSEVVSRAELDAMRNAGTISSEDTIWSGGGLATFSGQVMKNHGWILGTADDAFELSRLLGVSSSLRTVRQLPREWKSVAVTIAGKLTGPRVNQIMRSVSEAIESQDVNFVLFNVKPTRSDFSQALRLATFIAGLDADEVYTLAITDGEVRGAINIVPSACAESVLLAGSVIGADIANQNETSSESVHRGLEDFAQQTSRPLPLLAALACQEVLIKQYVQQETGKKAIFTDWQIQKQQDANLWQAKQVVAGGGVLEPELAQQYRLVDSIDNDAASALSRLGISEAPTEMKMSWIDSATQALIAQPWIPRLLLTLGFFALLAELGNPGISVGGFTAALCFVGFFWIENLNGNVEALEVLLFVCGLIALALEVFVIPGFGVFGIGGLLMLLVSVVLASQTFIWPTTSGQLNEVAVNLFWVACLAMGSMIGLLLMHKQLERSPLLRWVTLNPAAADDLEEREAREALTHLEHLLGQEGLTTTRLNPSGKAQFGSDIVAVVGPGRLIGEGIPVRVIEVFGSRVLIEELESIG